MIYKAIPWAGWYWRIRERLALMPDCGWLALFAAGLRLPTLGFESIWYDEAFTVWLARLDLPHLFAALPGDIHPPLWYLIEWGVVRTLGYSEWAVRLPAAIFGILDVILIWRVADLLGFDRRTKWIAGGLVAVLPSAIYYSQDARMYPMLAFLVLWMIIAVLKGRWLYFTIAGILAVYLHNLAPFYVAVIWLVPFVSLLVQYFNVRSGRPRSLMAEELILRGLVRRIIAGLAIFLAWLAWLPVMLQMTEHLEQGFWILPLDLGQAIIPLFTMTMGWRLPDILQMHVYVASLGMTAIALIVCRKWLWSYKGGLILAVAFGFPLLIALISISWRSVYLARAMLPAALVIMLLWAYALTHLSRANRLAALAVLLPMLGLGVGAHYFPAVGRFDARGWTATMTDRWQSEDIIYCVSIDGYITSGYYSHGLAAAIMPQATDLSQSLSVDTKEAMGFHQWEFDSLARRGFKRAWLLASETSLSSKAELDELKRITTTYPSQLIRAYDDGHIKQWIYLVMLNQPSSATNTGLYLTALRGI